MPDQKTAMGLTADLIYSWNPCGRYPLSRLREICGVNGLTPLEVCDLTGVSAEDKLWTLLREDVLSRKTLRLLASQWADRVLHLFEEPMPGDSRPREAIAVARRFAVETATQEELAAARAAARAAAKDAAWDAARPAIAGV